MLAAALMLFAQLAAAAPWAGWTGGRPPECSSGTGQGANLWERAKTPELGHYCDLIAGASAKLAGRAPMAQAALDTSREAERTLPGHAASRVLEGRALAILGKEGEARNAMLEARARDASAFDDPTALLAWARVSARTGHPDEASDAYRILLPRASALAPSDRGAAFVEAGLLEAAVRGQSGIDEATSALREAVHETRDDALVVAVLGLALALDRRGDPEEARALLAQREHGDPRSQLAQRDAKDILGVAPLEESALVAVGLEGSDPAGARDAWEKYLASAPSSPWAAHARAHLASAGTASGQHRARGAPGAGR